MKRYELTDEFIEDGGRKKYRIKALIDFGNVKAGELGGYIEKEENLSQEDNAWVYGSARVSGNVWVSDNAWVYGDMDYATVKGLGTQYRTTTFFRTKEKEIGVRCGCFYGTLEEFRKKVMETHGETKKAREYLMIADLMEYKFAEE